MEAAEGQQRMAIDLRMGFQVHSHSCIVVNQEIVAMENHVVGRQVPMEVAAETVALEGVPLTLMKVTTYDEVVVFLHWIVLSRLVLPSETGLVSALGRRIVPHQDMVFVVDQEDIVRYYWASL